MKTTYLLKQGQIHTLATSRLDNLFLSKMPCKHNII